MLPDSDMTQVLKGVKNNTHVLKYLSIILKYTLKMQL